MSVLYLRLVVVYFYNSGNSVSARVLGSNPGHSNGIQAWSAFGHVASMVVENFVTHPK